MTIYAVMRSVMEEVGLRDFLRAIWKCRGFDPQAVLNALAEDGWCIWYDAATGKIKCVYVAQSER